jgi:hypothetical protein
MRRMRIHLLAAVVPAALMACSVEAPQQESTPVTPLLSAEAVTLPGAFYPLSPGNEWVYRYRIEFQLFPDDGPPEPPQVVVQTVRRRQTDYYEHEGTEYLVEEESVGFLTTAKRLYRQDRRGLYEADVPLIEGAKSGGPVLADRMQHLVSAVASRSNVDPACIASHLRRHAEIMAIVMGSSPQATPPGDGLQRDELLRLAYPLRPGAAWVVRDEPLFVSTVEGVDPGAGSPAYRIRMDSDLFGPDDQVHFWYGRCGFGGMRAHLEGVAFDMNGHRLGYIVSEETWDLVGVDIDRAGCEVRPETDDHGGNVNSYPIQAGNRWTYEIRTSVVIGGGPPVVATTIADDEQVGWVDIEGRSYMKEVTTSRDAVPWTAVQYLRQDRAGLYSLDSQTSSARSAILGAAMALRGGAGEGEATQLVYPLKVGDTWTIRDNETLGKWTATVEGKDRLSLPAGDFDAHRIRVVRDYESVGDELFVWYARSGLVKVFAHSRTVKGYVEEEWTLQELDLGP